MAKDPKDSRIMEYKDTISQLNMTIRSQNELIDSLRQTIASNNEAMAVLNEKVDYLTKKLFGTSSEKSKNVEGQLSLFNEAEQETSPAGFHAADFLKGFKGYLETDCCQGCNGLPDVKRCCCWAHLRRYFVEAVHICLSICRRPGWRTASYPDWSHGIQRLLADVLAQCSVKCLQFLQSIM